MRTFTANSAKIRFGDFIDLAQKKRVHVMRRDSDLEAALGASLGATLGATISASDYEGMHTFYEERLENLLLQMADEARAMGLADDKLRDWLPDDN